MDNHETTDPPGADWFASTHWSQVLSARRNQDSAGSEALGKLCQTYWPPLYAYVRRKGFSPAEAEDMTQEFFARFIEKRWLVSVDRTKGKFRSFLLASMNHFLANEWDRRKAEKRGGRCKFISLDCASVEQRYPAAASREFAAERLFDREWALALLDRAMGSLREEYMAGNKARQFELLKSFLAHEGNAAEYAEVGKQLSVASGAVAVAVHRLRQRFRSLIRAEVAHTVSDSEQIESEMRYLLETLTG